MNLSSYTQKINGSTINNCCQNVCMKIKLIKVGLNDDASPFQLVNCTRVTQGGLIGESQASTVIQ